MLKYTILFWLIGISGMAQNTETALYPPNFDPTNNQYINLPVDGLRNVSPNPQDSFLVSCLYPKTVDELFKSWVLTELPAFVSSDLSEVYSMALYTNFIPKTPVFVGECGALQCKDFPLTISFFIVPIGKSEALIATAENHEVELRIKRIGETTAERSLYQSYKRKNLEWSSYWYRENQPPHRGKLNTTTYLTWKTEEFELLVVIKDFIHDTEAIEQGIAYRDRLVAYLRNKH